MPPRMRRRSVSVTPRRASPAPVAPPLAVAPVTTPSWTLPTPTVDQAAVILIVVRLLGTLTYGLISDCDETFNYWEPAHYLLYGTGLQTWEYAPLYALRSYAYVGLHAVAGFFLGGLYGEDKISVFHRIRLLLAVACAMCEAAFYAGVLRRFGKRIALFTFLGLLTSAGMLHAAPAFLPSTFTMFGLLLAWGAWLRGVPTLAVAAAAVGIELGWPFAVVAIVPMAAHIVVFECLDMQAFVAARSVRTAASWRGFLEKLAAVAGAGAVTTAVVLGSAAATDRVMFGRWLIAPWNIIHYNVFAENKGGDLYGTEPWHFFARNLALNFSVLAALAAASPFAVLSLAWRAQAATGKALATASTLPPVMWAAAVLGQLWLWFAVMSSKPHKEERFMFVIYPLVPLAAAFTLDAIFVAAAALFRRCCHDSGDVPKGRRGTVVSSPAARWQRITALGCVTAVYFTTGAFSVSRIAAQVTYFSAPFRAWEALARHVVAPPPGAAPATAESPYPLTALAYPLRFVWGDGAGPAELRDTSPGARVCVGKEWYRFPSSFYLPESTSLKASLLPSPLRKHTPGGPLELSYVRSHLTSLLPQAFLVGRDGASTHREGFNDLNMEDASRYVPWESCDYIVDFKLPTPPAQQDTHLEPWFWGESQTPISCHLWTADMNRSDYWRSIWSAPFLHADSTTRWYARALLLPFLPASHTVFGEYHVLQREAPSRCT